jgi:heme/copper-type cytochrome/quinol oxidase subunit 3
MGASAPAHPHIEPEPPEWQPRAIWVSGRLLCGAISFFFASFLFAYFYLRSLDLGKTWTIGAVHPSKGLGVAIMALFVVGAVIYRLAAKRPPDVFVAGVLAIVMSLLAVALQFFEYTILDFGASSGGYASVFIGWTALYAIVALMGIYWIEVQMANLWRIRRKGVAARTETASAEMELLPAAENELLRASIEASSFYWGYFVAIGFLAWVILYLVGP